jgi:hypothetical protein
MTSGPVSGSQALADRYEELRLEALGRSSLSSSGQGLALVVCNGLMSWMQAWSRCVSPAIAVSYRQDSAVATQLVPGMQTDLVRVLVTMALEQAAAKYGRTYR